MFNPFKRHAAHRPALQPTPGTRAFEVDAGSEWVEASDWAAWEDSLPQYDDALPFDAFERARNREH